MHLYKISVRSLLLVLIVFFQIIQGQNQLNTSSKSAYADSLLEKANAIFYSNPDSSNFFTNQALEFAFKNGLEVDKALAWQSLAKSDVLKGDVELALERLKDAIVIFEKHNQQENLAKAYSLMSIAVGKIHNDRESINLLLKAITIYERISNTDGLRSSLVNLANSYSDVKEYDKALEALHESKPFIESGSSEWFYYYINAGIIYQSQKKYALAKIQFDSCLAISFRNKMVDAEVTAYTDMADLLLETKRHSDAIVNYNKAIVMARKNNLPVEELEALEGLLKSYEAIADFKNAFYCQSRLDVITDSLFNIEKIKNINAIETRLKVSEKEKTIALQNLKMKEGKERIRLLVLGTLLLIVILFFTYYTYLKVKRQKVEVEIQKSRAEQLNHLNQKIFAVIAHDFKSPLITLNMLIDLMDKENISKEDLNAYSADVRNQIIQSGQILENLLNWAKSELNLTKNSNQSSFPKIIADEIIKELDYMALRKNVNIVNCIDKNMQLKLPPDILKIIIRNLASNAVKFSHSGGEVIIGSDADGNVFVKDNGIGIDEKAINHLFNGTIKSKLGTFNETGFGLGLYITYELVTKFSGKLWVEKNQPNGTVFKFALINHE